MPDINPWAIFWTALFAAVPTVLTQVLSHIRQMKGISDGNKKIDENTLVTKEVGTETSRKLDSATKDVKDQATSVAVVATKAVTKAEQAVTTNQKDLGEIKQNVEVVKKAVNGEGTRSHDEGYAKGLIDGAQLLTRVNSNSERLNIVENRMDSFDGRIKHVEENTGAILTILQGMAQLPAPKIKEVMNGH